jgi:hypothetical protein
MSVFHSAGMSALLSLGAVALCLEAVVEARAQDGNGYGEIETKYIFGFTEGSSIGLEGEKEFSATTFASFGQRDGRYGATQTKLEFEHTPTQFIQLEFGALVSSHNIKNVTDLDDRNSVNFMGLFGEFRALLIERGASSPIAAALSIEPVWRRIDETGGARVTNLELEMKINADMELIRNRVYLGFNAIYEPEWTRTREGEIEKESTLGLSTAIAFRPTPPLVIGAELGYFRHYAGIGFDVFEGDAIFLGPTLYYKLTNKSFMTAAWASQIAGHAVGDPGPLNLANFPRHRAKLKYAVEF